MECRNCSDELKGQRSNARQCPECRIIQVLEYMVHHRKRVRKCMICGQATRSAGRYDLAYCADCIAVKLAGPAPNKTMTDIARGTVTRCGFCSYDATTPPPPDAILAKLLKLHAATGTYDIAIAARRAKLPPVELTRPAMDPRVPLCLACAKSPTDQGKVLAWLEARQRARAESH